MKILKYISIALFGLVICGLGYIYSVQKMSIPKMSGTLESKHLLESVEIIRDKEGIPHIYAKNSLDLHFALGYTHASDRIFQFELLRRAGAGKLSEVLGKSTLKFDILFRTLGTDKIFKDNIERLDPEIKSKLQKYMDGINHFVQTHPLPIEFKILGITPKEYTLIDAYYVITYMAYSFTPMLREDILYSEIERKLKVKRDLYNLKVNTPETIKKDMSSTLTPGAKLLSQFYDLDKIQEGLGPIEGSNAWSISGKHTVSGAAMLSSDPHITFSLPNIWYEVHLNSEDDNFEMYAHLLPIIPFPAMGHNNNLGWGLTMTYFDDLDVFKEEIENGYYLRDGIKKKAEILKEIIKIKGENDYHLNLVWTDRGPLVGHLFGMKNISIKWAFHEPSNEPIKAFYRMSRSNTLGELKSNIHFGKSPGVNILYADKEGNIAHLIFGAAYKREAGVNNDGINKNGVKTQGIYDFNLKPHRINPKDGYLVSTNDRPPHMEIDVRGSWYPKNRHDTALELLKKKKKWTPEMMKEVQTSNLDIFALEFKETIVQDLSAMKLSGLEKKALDQLKKWDGKSEVDSVGATIYNHFNFHFFEVVMDELEKEDMQKYAMTTASWSFHQRLMRDSTNSWWDNISTKEVEDRKAVLKKILEKTVSDLKEQLGSDVDSWQWGKIHTIEYPHPFGRNKFMAKFFNLGPYPVSGAINVVNHMRRKGITDGHKVKSGPSTRRIIDFSNPRKSLGILPLGNSGHYLSPFFDNQRERFLKGEYRDQLMERSDIEKNQFSKLILKPLEK